MSFVQRFMRKRTGMHSVGVGFLGLGTVGLGAVTLLETAAERIAQRAGRRIEIRGVLVRDLTRQRATTLRPSLLTTDPDRILGDPNISIIVEVLGGIHPARELVLAAFAAGKDVVTANKALLAEHGPEIVAQARKYGRALAFEASVGGGIPIIQALSVGLAANEIQALSAIVNGTCNFILSAMTLEGLPYAEAVRQAQELGYAEPDPELDVNGTDTAHKLAVLAQVAFNADVRTAAIPREGIDRLQQADIKYAGELGYTLKLLAQAKRGQQGIELRVAPRLVRQGTPLADVRGPYNAIRVVGDVVGDTLFYGRGAGAMPTASAIAGDLIDVISGRAQLTFDRLDLWNEAKPSAVLASPSTVRSRYYLRFTIADRPGVLGAIADVLGQHAISIASVIQHDPGGDALPESAVPLVIMTHSAVEAELKSALAKIDLLPVVQAPSICLGVED
jgi:homoserine dehydrogenase